MAASSSFDGRSELPRIGRKATFGRSEQCYSGSIRNTRLREAHRSGRGDFGLLKGTRRLRFPPNRGGQVSLLRHSSLRLAAFLQLGKARSTHVLVTTFSFCNSKPDRTLGKGENLRATLYSPPKKKDLPRCRNTQHSVALPSCPYKFHTSLFPPVLRNQNWLPGPRKSTIVARPPFRAIAKWRPEVGWGRD